jgi:hypothetical protein
VQEGVHENSFSIYDGFFLIDTHYREPNWQELNLQLKLLIDVILGVLRFESGYRREKKDKYS